MTTRLLSMFVADTGPDAVPPEARELARRHCLDTFGVMLAPSSRDGAAEIVATMVARMGGRPESAIVGGRFRSAAPWAALANGTAACLDDAGTSRGGHRSASLVSALLAVGERYELPGEALVDAYAIGWEVGARVSSMLGDRIHEIGFDSVGVVGSVASAAACSRMLDQAAAEAANALGIAASLASGLESNGGTDTEPLLAGHGARHGVVAAELARRGFTATSDLLESQNGFGRAFAREAFDPGKLARGLADEWDILTTGVHLEDESELRQRFHDRAELGMSGRRAEHVADVAWSFAGLASLRTLGDALLGDDAGVA